MSKEININTSNQTQFNNTEGTLAYSVQEKYVAYYRVSTKKQGKSGLGLDAQRKAIQSFTKGCDNCVIDDFQDIESGSKNERIGLAAAMELCKDTGATLLIAKLDRLARKASFILALQASQIKFVACDNPHANNLTVGILAILAEDELQKISTRIKEALAILKAKGIKLGRPPSTEFIKHLLLISSKGVQAIQLKTKTNPNTKKAYDYMRMLRNEKDEKGKKRPFEIVANILNEKGFKTPSGKEFSRGTVYIMLKNPQRYIELESNKSLN